MMAITSSAVARDGHSRRRFAKAFKAIRSRIRRYDPLSIIERCVVTLHHPAIRDPSRWAEGHIRSYQPWNLFLIIKWTYTEGRFCGLPAISEASLVDLVNRVLNLGRFQDPAHFDSIRLFFKNVAFQQFWFQQVMDRAKLARPLILFSTLPPRDEFEGPFTSAVGISLEQYFDLSFVLLSRFLPASNSHTNVTVEYFEPVHHVYGRQIIETFLDALAMDLRGARAFLKNYATKIRDPVLGLYEQTPLKEYPLLKRSGVYLCYSPVVLQECLAHFVYDTLRQTDPDVFGRRFGPVFETYADKNVQYLRRRYYRERELKAITGPGVKTTDFVIPYDGATVLIEAKGVELSPLARISPSAGVIARSLKSTAMKAVSQAISTARLLKDLRDAGKAITEEGPCYCLVVTYKRLFLGTAKDIVAELEDDERRDFLGEEGAGLSLLPLEHIYFVSIEDLEHAAALEEGRLATIAQALQQSVAKDANPATTSFEFGQHLDAIDSGVRFPEHLTEEFETLTGRVKRQFRTGEL